MYVNFTNLRKSSNLTWARYDRLKNFTFNNPFNGDWQCIKNLVLRNDEISQKFIR